MTKRFFPIAITIIAVFAAVLSALSAGGVAYAAEEERAQFILEPSEYTVVVGDSSVVVYFDDFRGFDFEYIYTLGEETEVFASRYPHFLRIEEYESAGYSLGMKIIREADEEYERFEREIPLETNIAPGVVPISLPYGQRIVYDGTEHVFDNVRFLLNGEEAAVTDVGEYLAEMDYGGQLGTVHTVLRVEKATVTVSARNTVHRYKELVYPDELTVRGNVPADDLEYVREHSSVTMPSYSAELSAGQYDIFAEYTGKTFDNFDVVTEKGIYTVSRALLSGFEFTDAQVLYDGKPHALRVKYDELLWSGITVDYTVVGAIDAGKYLCTATVKKDNYEDLVLTAYLTVLTTTLIGNNVGNAVTLSGADGFDPTWGLVAEANERQTVREAVEGVLASDAKSREVILGIYDVKAVVSGGEKMTLTGNFTIKIKPEAVKDSDGIKLYRYADGAVVPVDYRYTDGAFVFEATGTDGFIFVGREKVQKKSPFTILGVIILGLVILIILSIIFDQFGKDRKERRKWRKRHSRWA